MSAEKLTNGSFNMLPSLSHTVLGESEFSRGTCVPLGKYLHKQRDEFRELGLDRSGKVTQDSDRRDYEQLRKQRVLDQILIPLLLGQTYCQFYLPVRPHGIPSKHVGIDPPPG
jgi:hypothetical protein